MQDKDKPQFGERIEPQLKQERIIELPSNEQYSEYFVVPKLDKNGQPRVSMFINDELVYVTEDTARYIDKLNDRATSKSKPGNIIAGTIFAVAIVGPLAIWLYRLVLGI